MSIINNISNIIFTNKYEVVWQNLSEELNGNFIKGKYGTTGTKVVIHHRKWIITLDTYSDGDPNSVYCKTRMRAPYLNKDGFLFEIYKKPSGKIGLLLDKFFGKKKGLFGKKEVKVGFLPFDDDFRILSNNEEKAKELFKNSKIRELIYRQPCHLSVKRYFGLKSPESIDHILYFEQAGIIQDFDRLKQLFDLFIEFLNQLYLINSAYKNDAESITLR